MPVGARNDVLIPDEDAPDKNDVTLVRDPDKEVDSALEESGSVRDADVLEDKVAEDGLDKLPGTFEMVLKIGTGPNVSDETLDDVSVIGMPGSDDDIRSWDEGVADSRAEDAIGA